MTAGPLLVRLQGGVTLHFSGGRDYLDIVRDALDGVAEQAEAADDRTVNRHQHIEYLPGDHHRSAGSTPLVIVADWPGKRSNSKYQARGPNINRRSYQATISINIVTDEP